MTKCFTGDTLVLMADGSAKPVSEIQYGDLVLTKSDTTGLVEAKAVTQVFSHEEPSTLRLTFGDGSAIRTTPEHPFWVDGRGWIPAGRLAIGNAIVTRAGPTTKEKSAVVASVKTVRGRAKVYNFSVEDSHTYFVQDASGQGKFKWVHNGCDQLHHIFPQKWRSWFSLRGLEIDKFTVSLTERIHLSGVHGRGGLPFPNGQPGILPGRYNALWRDFISQNPNATLQEVRAFGDQLMNDFGLKGLPIVPYR